MPAGIIGAVRRIIANERRGAAILEFAAAAAVMFLAIIGIYAIACLYWGAAVMSSTADIASLSGQVAYNRWRLPSSAFSDTLEDREDQRRATEKAVEASDFVVRSFAEQISQGSEESGTNSILWIFDGACGSGESVGPFTYRTEVGPYPAPRPEGVSPDTIVVSVALSAQVRWKFPGSGTDSACLSFTSRAQAVKTG